MRYHVAISFALVSLAILNCQAASLNLDEECKFKTKKGECVTVIEKPKPNDKDVYCKEYYEFSGRPVVPLVPKEGKHPALPMEFPHAAAIGFNDGKNNEINWSCGGVLISKQHVLTSGRCLRNTLIGEAKFIRLGDLNIRSKKAGPYRQDFNIKQIFIHPDYKNVIMYHDIGIALLDKPVDVNPYAVPACLNTKAEIPLKENYAAIGWGVSKNGPSEILEKVVLNIVENKECKEKYQSVSLKVLPNGIDDDLYICVGAPKTSTCSGDSGGPLQQVNDKGVAIVYGLISFGPTQCQSGKNPEVHTRVSRYVDWIKSIIE